MKNSEYWEDKYKVGTKYEDRIIEKFKQMGKPRVIKKCFNYEYDIKLENGAKYEIKKDSPIDRTGNAFIEFMYHGRDSGIKTTRANYYVIGNDTYFIIVKVDVLKKIIADDDAFTYGYYLEWTDTWGYLVDIQLIKEKAEEIILF